MKVTTTLDVEVIARQTDEVVHVLLELEAPTLVPATERATKAVQIVLDRSGSMSGAPLAAAKTALVSVVDRLQATDSFGVVVFDNRANVVVPCAPLADKALVKHLIAQIEPGGSTDLSAGLLLGMQELTRVRAPGGASLLVLSDGHANAGIVDADTLASLAQRSARKGSLVSTIGIGTGYDEVFLAAIATGGQGAHEFAEEADACISAIVQQVDGLLAQSVTAATITVEAGAAVREVTVVNDLPCHTVDGNTQVDLGSLWSGEVKRVLLSLQVAPVDAEGALDLAGLRLRWVALPELESHTVEVPVKVSVVGAEQAADRVVNPTVREELAFLAAQRARIEAARAMRDGDRGLASEILTVASSSLSLVALGAAARLEVDELLADARSALTESEVRMSKRMTSESHRKRTQRGRPGV